mgnify:CR=1 FL=1
MRRLDRVLAAGARQRQLEVVRTGALEPNWDKFFGRGAFDTHPMDVDELAAYKAMAIRIDDILKWYEEQSSEHYDEELEFLERARRFDAQPMLHYNVQTSHAVATGVRDAIPFLQETRGQPRAPFYRLHRGAPIFHEGPTGNAYHIALMRLKLYFEGKVREQAEAQLFGGR